MQTRVLPRLGDAARALVASHRDAGERLVLTTATNRFLTEPIAAALGFAADALIATELAEARRRLHRRQRRHPQHARGQGRRGWRHGSRPADLPASALAEATFYSDSANDLPLLCAVGRAVAVDPDPRLRTEAARRGWPCLSLARISA